MKGKIGNGVVLLVAFLASPAFVAAQVYTFFESYFPSEGLKHYSWKKLLDFTM